MAIVPSDNPFEVPSFAFDLTTPKFYWWKPRPAGNNYGQAFGGYLYTALYKTSAQYRYLIASPNPEILWTYGSVTDPSELIPDTLYNNINNYTFDNKTVYWISSNMNTTSMDIVETNAPYTVVDLQRYHEQCAWLMVYGGYSGYKVTYDMINCTGDSENPATIEPNATVTPANFTANEGAVFGPDSVIIDGSGFPEGNPVYFNWDPMTGLLQIGPVTSDIIVHVNASSDPYTPDGNSDEGGGHGDFNGDSDSIDIPPLPDLSAVDTGFITLFNPSTSQLQALANYMWSSLFDLDTFKKLFADPMSCILGLSIVPVNVPSGGTGNVTVGNIPTGVSMTKAARQYVEVDCGTINVNEYWGAYLDYDPYTKAEIYLPYIGTHPIAVDDIMGKAVHVVYHVDVLSGACIAYVKCGDSVLYSFIGQCSSSIPITGNDWTNVINGVLSIAGAVGTMVATGGASAPISASMIASTAVNSLKPSVEKSGSLSGTGGIMGIQVPYLILTRPRQALPKDQNKFIGYPSFINVSINSLSGYTEIESVHLDNVPATDSEIDEIESILKSGVIF